MVKVERPGLDETMALDSAAIMQLAGLIERRTTLGLTLRPSQLAAEFIDNVREELDFRIEAANAEAIALAVSGADRVRVPAVFPALSTKRMLTEERVGGHSVADIERLRSLGIDPSDLARRLVDAFVIQIFDAGVFHADPHPGNILVEDDGTIVLIDLGAVGRLGPNQRDLVLQMLAGAMLATRPCCARPSPRSRSSVTAPTSASSTSTSTTCSVATCVRVVGSPSTPSRT